MKLDDKEVCTLCKGKRFVIVVPSKNNLLSSRVDICPKCSGTGKIKKTDKK